jgi:hypothetical protein
MLWFTFKVTFGTIPAGWVGGWLAGWLGGKELIIRLAQSSWGWSWDLSLAIFQKGYTKKPIFFLKFKLMKILI